jgi:hypothetical protein
MLWIEHIRTNRDNLGEADARHCQPPGAWRIVVHDLDISNNQIISAAFMGTVGLNWQFSGRPVVSAIEQTGNGSVSLPEVACRRWTLVTGAR